MMKIRIVLVTLLCAIFAQAQTLELNDAWQMQSTVLVKEEAKTVSSPVFEPKNWYPTKPGWTVLNTLTKSGVYPDMRLGMNNYQIPDISDTFNEKHKLGRFSYLPNKQNPWTSPYWFRKTFSLKNIDAGKTLWLEIDCINYRAEIWLNGNKIAGKEQVAGIFERFQFDVSKFVKKGDNVLAVKIFPPDHPAEPGTQSVPLGDDRPYVSDMMKDMTMVMSQGYDCFPTVRDRNMGILQGVRIRQTGQVALRNPFVKTEMRIPKTDQATISISAELVNAKDKPQKAILRGRIEGTDYAFEQSVMLKPKETTTVRIRPFFMQKPELWFPHGHGEQHLYTLSLKAVDETGAVFDAQDVRFGVRQITTHLHEYKGGYGRQIFINGKRIFCRGGYIQPDAMLEWDREQIEAEFRYYKEAGLNLIYFEDIPNPPDWFLDLCDEHGILFGNCYFACFWMRPGTDYPLDLNLVESGAIDITKRYRNHPSMIMYLCMNEETTREDVYGIWRNIVQEHDGTRFWIPSAYFPDERYEQSPDWVRQDMPVGMTDIGGSYGWLPLKEYFRKVKEDTRWMFMMESGSASLPPIESLRLFLPDIDSKKRQNDSNIFPLDSAWAEHGGNHYYRPYHQAIYWLFSAPNDVADYCRKGHVLTADQNRAMFEAVQHQIWDITSGFTKWKLNSAWPSIQWQIFDFFHRPMVSYYFIKKANRPVHVLWSPLDDKVYVVNHKPENFQGTVYADVFDFNMKKIFSGKQPVNISSDSSSEIGLQIERYDNLPEGVYFMKLRLVDEKDTPVSDNFYWIPTQETLTGLEKLPPVSLTYSESFREDGDETVGTLTINNPTDRLAFFVRAILQKDKDELEVLPVFWSDNYISLLPGETQTLEVRISTKLLAGQKPVVRLEGWSLEDAKNVSSLPRSTPEKEGVLSQGILDFLEAVEQSGEEWHSFVLLRHGKVIAEGWWNPYRPELKHTIYSVSKTFTATAIGFAVSENLLNVRDKVISFFPDLLPESISPYLAQMTVQNLLSMTAGQDREPFHITRGEEWAKHFFSLPVVDEPGTKFLYNSLGTYMLSAIIQKVTGQRMLDYLQSLLFQPLAISHVDWEISPEEINTGGWGLRIHTEDMAKLGQLYLQKGKWNGKQLLPEAWIQEATTAKIIQKPELTPEQREKDDWAQGYCYQIWRCQHNAFRADGAFGQYIIVMPDQDAVIAIQGDIKNMQKGMNLVWDYLLPAMQDKALSENQRAETALKQKSASLAIAAPKGVDSNLQSFPEKETVYRFTDNEKNETVLIRFSADTCFVKWMDNTLIFGKERWIAGETLKPVPNLVANKTGFREFPPFKTCGSYCRTDEQSLSLSLKYTESPHTEKFVFNFSGDSIAVKISNSMNYGTFAERRGVISIEIKE